ncbi:MAG TPA: lmo0937 family membrane protein [Chloroflexota bacterium]|nr:lmo0937 family membrane protein [Chloroflexota bacterium]
MLGLLYTVAVILLALWIIGLVVHVTFWAIHLLLVAAVIIVLWNLLTGRRSTI